MNVIADATLKAIQRDWRKGGPDDRANAESWAASLGLKLDSQGNPITVPMDEGQGAKVAPVASEIRMPAQPAVPKEASGIVGKTIEAVAFLKQWCAATKTFPVLTAIHVDPVTGEKGLIESEAFKPLSPGEPDWRSVFAWVEQRNGKANIYFNVNARTPGTEKKIKVKLTEVSRVVAWHVDVDVRVGEDQAEGIARIVKSFEKAKHPPTVITSSGGGAQAFWVLKEPIALDGTEAMSRDVAGYNRSLERDLNGDACHNLDRIMRLPGTVNVPNKLKREKGRKPRLAEVVQADWSRVYTLTDFEKMGAPSNITAAVQSGGEGQGTPDTSAPKPKGKTPSDALDGYTYENVPGSDDRPIMTLDDPRLASMDRWCKEYARTKTLPEDAPTDLCQHLGNVGWWDFKICSELVRLNLTGNQIKQVWKAGALAKDADQWPRGFDGDMDRIIERAREAARDPDIEAFNRDHFVINMNGKTRIGTWRESLLHPGQRDLVLSTVDDFKFLHRRLKKVIMVKERDEDGNETGNLKERRVSLVDYWLRHPQCRQYENGQAFMPNRDAQNVGGRLNLWQGFAFEPKSGDWSLFKKHMLDNLCAGNHEHFEYLIRWMAFIVQKRKPTHVVVLLRSEEEGTGKGFWANHFGKLFGPAFMQVTNPDHVIGKFNPHLENLLLLNADEALFAGDPRHRNALWSLTTEPTITIEPKGFAVYKAPNYLNFIITTNADEAVRVTRTARRIFALDVAAHQVGYPEYFDAIEEQLRDGGYEAMLHELQNVDLSNFDVRKCPKTEALRKQIAHGRHGIERLIEEACSTGIVPCASARWPGFTLVGGYEDRRGFVWFIANHSDSDLKRMGAHRVKSALKKWGCIIGQGARKRERSGSGLAVVRGIEWPPLTELRARFVELHGPQEWESPDATEWMLPTADAAPGEGQGARDQGRGGSDDVLPF